MSSVERFEYGHEVEVPPTTFAFRDEKPLKLKYQMKKRDGAIVGVEALLREEGQPKNEVPKDVLKRAEASGRMHELTMAIFAQACREAAYWDQLKLDVPIAVNMTADDLTEHGVEEIHRVIQETGADPRTMEIEITERVRVTPATRRVVQQLQHMGFRFALDDFGTGFSDDEALSAIPEIDIVKIDRQVVESGRAWDMAQKFLSEGKTVVLEGVSADQMHLVPKGAIIQSFADSEPVPPVGIIKAYKDSLGTREGEDGELHAQAA
jgi:EAL domain-containing protein (putative c-di-GMP-specific phosphodiesterase class I)